ncbi:MAG: hypothetical protein ACXQT3_06275 [Methermicoccaceae archaeon]
MRDNDLRLVWHRCLKLYAEGDKLRAEGDKLRAEGDKLRAEGDKLWAEGDKLRAEGNKLRAEGNKLWAEGNKLWADAVLRTRGNVTIEWKLWNNCVLGTDEKFGPEDPIESDLLDAVEGGDSD